MDRTNDARPWNLLKSRACSALKTNGPWHTTRVAIRFLRLSGTPDARLIDIRLLPTQPPPALSLIAQCKSAERRSFPPAKKTAVDQPHGRHSCWYWTSIEDDRRLAKFFSYNYDTGMTIYTSWGRKSAMSRILYFGMKSCYSTLQEVCRVLVQNPSDL